MELPINIIIVFFVVLVVGGAIAVFAQRSLSHSQDQLNDQFKKDNQDLVIEVASATDSTIVGLANECVRKGKENSIGSKSICFAVFATSWPDFASLDGTQLEQGYALNTTGVTSAAPRAVRISFDPRGQVAVSE